MIAGVQLFTMEFQWLSVPFVAVENGVLLLLSLYMEEATNPFKN